MVRYARAKGSKASNEKLPNNPTPWHVMKEQLENVQKSKEQDKTIKQESDANDKELYYPSQLNTNTDWAEFEGAPVKKEKQEPHKRNKINKKGKNPQNNAKRETESQNNDSQEMNNDKPRKPMTQSCKRRLRRIRRTEEKSLEESKTKENVDLEEKSNLKREGEDFESPKSKQIKNEEIKVEVKEENIVDVKNEGNNESTESNNISPANKLTQSAKRRLKRKQKQEKMKMLGETEEKSEKTMDGSESAKKSGQNEDESKMNSDKPFLTKRQKRNLKHKLEKSKKEGDKSNDQLQNGNWDMNDRKPFQGPPKKIPRHNHQSTPKVRDDKEHPRRKPDQGAVKMIINGVEVEIVKFDGFPVRKEDAERLKELRQQMIIKGIPKNEIENAMKLERRKAEKVIARLRKSVCFMCRKAGHNLSDCPNLDKEQASVDICFKCGSTEHTHFECKVNKTDDYRFAKCFICRQQGHIAKQCPDNPKGLYPDGGCCNVCGDVTHLKKDCPDLIKKKEESTLTVKTIENDTLECLDEDLEKKVETPNKKQKVVTF